MEIQTSKIQNTTKIYKTAPSQPGLRLHNTNAIFLLQKFVLWTKVVFIWFDSYKNTSIIFI